MAAETRKPVRHTLDLDKRGGYGSSSKQVSMLTTPPRGPAPGVSKRSEPSGQK